MSAPARLWNPSFLLWWLGSTQSNLGSALAALALSFLVLHQTGSAGAMGVTLAIGMLPTLLAPLAGTLVDRMPLRLPLVAGDVLRGALQLGLGLAALHGSLPLSLINSLSFVNGLLGQLVTPAAMSVLPQLVPKQHITRASGLMASSGQFAQLIGLVGGGLLISHLGSAPSLMIDGLSFLLMAALLPFIALPIRAASSGAGFWSDFRAGYRYARGNLLTLMLPVIGLFINASLAPMELLLPKRMTLLEAGAQGYGVFVALLTAGALVSSLAGSALNTRLPLRSGSAAGLTGIGLSMLMLSFTTTAVQMDVVAILIGCWVGFTNICIGALFATIISPEYRGRVSSLMNALGTVGQPLTLLALAPVADRVPTGQLFGIASLVILLGTSFWVYALVKARAAKHDDDPAVSS